MSQLHIQARITLSSLDKQWNYPEAKKPTKCLQVVTFVMSGVITNGIELIHNLRRYFIAQLSVNFLSFQFFSAMIACFFTNLLLSAFHGTPLRLSAPGLVRFDVFPVSTCQSIIHYLNHQIKLLSSSLSKRQNTLFTWKAYFVLSIYCIYCIYSNFAIMISDKCHECFNRHR